MGLRTSVSPVLFYFTAPCIARLPIANIIAECHVSKSSLTVNLYNIFSIIVSAKLITVMISHIQTAWAWPSLPKMKIFKSVSKVLLNFFGEEQFGSIGDRGPLALSPLEHVGQCTRTRCRTQGKSRGCIKSEGLTYLLTNRQTGGPEWPFICFDFHVDQYWINQCFLKDKSYILSYAPTSLIQLIHQFKFMNVWLSSF